MAEFLNTPCFLESIGNADKHRGKFCELKIWPNFIGYGFNLHAEKGNPSHIVGKVDPKSPAEAAGMKEGDRIAEVNGVNVLNEHHSEVVKIIKSDPRKVTVLLVSSDCEVFLRQQGSQTPGELLEISHFACPDNSPFTNSVGATRPASSTDEAADQASGNYTANNFTSAETEGSSSAVTSQSSSLSAATEPRYRLCHMKRSEGDAKSFGFTMHASKGQPGHFITEIDPDSIAERAGLRVGDVVIEVNGANVEAVSHKQVVDMIKAVPNETFLLVMNNFKNHDFQIKSNNGTCHAESEESNKNKVNSVQNQNQEDDAEDNISADYRLITDEIIAVAEREAKTDKLEVTQKSANAITLPEENVSSVNRESSLNSNDDSESEAAKKSPVVISGIEFASSAEEARQRMKKKSRVKEENLSIRDKFRLFEKL